MTFICCSVEIKEQDWLIPYKYQHGARHHHRVIREIQPEQYGNITHETYPSHTSQNITLPIVDIHPFIHQVNQYFMSHYVTGHISIVNNPGRTVSVIEPGGPGGCAKQSRETVRNSALTQNCILAHNAGFFDTLNGSCKGKFVLVIFNYASLHLRVKLIITYYYNSYLFSALFFHSPSWWLL